MGRLPGYRLPVPHVRFLSAMVLPGQLTSDGELVHNPYGSTPRKVVIALYIYCLVYFLEPRFYVWEGDCRIGQLFLKNSVGSSSS